jgi:ribosome-associated protein
MGKRKKDNSELLIKCIINAIDEKKGKEVVSLELGKLPNAICKYFVVCHADSTTQVEAIAQNIEDKVLEILGEKVWQKGGYENRIWVILDYVDIVVHVFQTEWRYFYKLEQLWADAKTTNHTSTKD